MATRRAAPLAVLVVTQLVGMVLLLAALPVALPPHLAASDALWGVGSGITGAIGVALLYRGLSTGDMSVVAPITAVCAAAFPVVVGIGLGERPHAAAMGGIVLALIGVVLLSLHETKGERPRSLSGSITTAV